MTFTHCKQCVMPTSRPGLVFDEEGICSACRWHEKKASIDWVQRAQQFQDIADWAKAATRAPFDCVLGVSGGKDSLWQAHQLRDGFGLNPLLVQYVSSDGTELGRLNAENMVRRGFTLLSLQPNPQVATRLARKSFLEHGNIVKASELALFTAPFRTALDYDIPLVLFGENPALEAGDVNRSSPGWDASGIRFSNTLSGAAVEQWLCDGIERRDLIPYTFPSVSELKQWGGRGIFMGYFLNWSGWQNGAFAFRHGMQPINEPYEDIGIYYRHNSLDSNNGAFVNSYLKYLKFGFGHTTEFSSYDVRAGRLTRAEATALVKKYDGKCHPRFIRDFCAWVGLSEEDFAAAAERWRGKMWRPDKAGQWTLENPVWSAYPDLDVDTDALIERVDTLRIATNEAA